MAGGHICFNLLAGAAALLLLPWLSQAAVWLSRLVSETGSASPALTLALFHTAINIGGVLLVGPFTKHITRFLSKRFQTAEETMGKPEFIDRTAAATPSLALDSLKLELGRMGNIARAMATSYLQAAPHEPQWYHHRADALARLEESVSSFIRHIQRLNLTETTASALVAALRVAGYYRVAGEAVAEGLANAGALCALPLSDSSQEESKDSPADTAVDNSQQSPSPSEQSPLALAAAREKAFFVLALEAVEASVTCERGYDAQASHSMYGRLTHLYAELKDALLQAGVQGGLDATALSARLEQARATRRAVEQITKGGAWLATLPDASDGCPEHPKES